MIPLARFEDNRLYDGFIFALFGSSIGILLDEVPGVVCCGEWGFWSRGRERPCRSSCDTKSLWRRSASFLAGGFDFAPEDGQAKALKNFASYE